MSFAYLPLFTGDYLRDTRHLTPLRHGVYILALMHCWDSKGPMPLDEQECAGICNCRSADEIEAMRYILGKYFVRMEDGHYNPRMQAEVEKSENISGKRSEAGKKGYEARLKHLPGKSQANAEAIAKQVHLSPSPSPSLTPAPTPSPPPPPSGGVPPPTPASADGTPAAPTSPGKTRKPKPKPEPALSAAAWNAYAEAYQARHGVAPVRNARTNAHMAGLVQRIGADESPAVARYYLTHRNALYVNAKHCTDLLLRDCEKLRTEWATGQATYLRDAREDDRIASAGAMWERVEGRLADKGIK